MVLSNLKSSVTILTTRVGVEAYGEAFDASVKFKSGLENKNFLTSLNSSWLRSAQTFFLGARISLSRALGDDHENGISFAG